MFSRSDFQAEQDLTDIIEETFDLCISNRDEICWLITILRGFIGIPNKRTDYNQDNFKLNEWQLELYPIFQRYRKKYCSLTYKPPYDIEASRVEGTNRGKKWYNNGTEQIFSDICPLGYKPGMLSKRLRKKRKF